MKALVLIVFFVSSLTVVPDLSQIRTAYTNASDSEKITNQLFDDLSSVDKKDNEILIAYKGAVSTLKAKYAKGIKTKKDYFKTGAELIEHAVRAKPRDIEIRCIRLSVQENSPKVVRYKNNIEDDKEFILENYRHVSSKEVREFIKNYVLQSSVFELAEKQLF
ncbi:MAG: hypothetical protein QM485_13165 [Flavobacteriaceae bacterium]